MFAAQKISTSTPTLHFPCILIHPRKEDEGVRLGLPSIFGSAKATQEADAVIIVGIILQNDGAVKFLDVRKNRYDGELGVVPLSVSDNAPPWVPP